ncbi:hypothetical protein PRLR5107_22050 [Prevotella lacticifex]|uniref:Uncharacterized protein n=2 Tax=Prevotella lacticifex TaxID=2854755 RepID=A0A9R1C785_9BACT|nr:hypothetical protein PRLR5003_22050 [Prevotella lacticifex]GJG40452.1 hypothetical protein PRLR5019_24230 [Prevotella lacticifex]GJG44149.1 hypothetical protein PRLR5025_29350 [Prevotella lacticifex]GJG46834.1 hypothetical protein PRLR5027_24290 [Prevotella lacticifex]GJG50546.1 hypothetical protein PRLR5052_29590 [Prevotella lacticifex]
MGAMVLATPLFLSSCSSSDDIADNPGNTTGEAVKTSFTLSVGLPGGSSSNAKPSTRMSDTEVQSTGNFRGIDNINLIPFAKTSAIASTDVRLGSNITLPSSATNGQNNVYESSAAKGTDHATVYANVSVPVGTASFLFYGKAIDNTAATAITSDADKHKFGTLTSEGLTGEPAAIKFSPVQIYTAGKADDKATTLADYLTSIASTKITVDGADVAWSATDNANNTIYPLYQQFIKIETGSSASVRAALQTIYESLKNNTDAMSKAVITSIKAKASVSDDGVVTLNEALQGFPGNLSTPIPDGCALVKWNTTNNKFEANLSGTSTSGQMTQRPADLVYPANLQYYANTTLKTSDTDQSSAYDGSNTWTRILEKYTTGTAVGPTTRSVALKDQIQYAVGRLDVTVKAGASTLNDREGKAISLTNGSKPSFPISAVLVGGQKQVVYDFTPTTTTDAKEYTIYDNAVPAAWGTTGVATDPSTVNHTLVLANAASTSVNIAVEFTNNSGTEFVGKDGIIGKGAKFYLLATLDPSSATETEKAKTGSQVFKQDFTTTAKLTINTNTGTTSGGSTVYDKGLANAYNVLPDLRTPKLSLGMSVDLNWQTGMTFEEEFK